ncbi:uncharacterized protein LAESUDRAFT_729021 [Laetiporus sulphureus 93-53]|uniref:Aspergillopepsin n=1 Tax=Laetiporus sulphureus 93-53 TaxID=1314785 RepID=A0A165CY40_9APHY|nr:uncharacterized protein LAESUDRAFT_729021 [Laetiporus sulphureus 93-53]KZT03720.1 hypothetical protein LAESUDRAFT_729021 [Laetiporus sulphureus 93-53]
MFGASLFSYLLLATAAVAAPRGTRLAERIARRATGSHRSQPLKVIEQSIVGDVTNDVQYSPNWAGAVYAESEGSFTAVTGTFTVPTPSVPSGSSGGTYSAAAWVGIDGDTCQNAILQTGVDFTVDENGDVSYNAWYEWYPEVSYDFSGISFSAGDVVQLTVTASSTTSGTAYIENLSTEQTVTQDLSSSYALCEENAEWIVEDYEEDGSLVAFADFGTVTFTNAEATYDGETVGPSTATLINIEQDGEVLTSVSTDSSSVTISYQ